MNDKIMRFLKAIAPVIGTALGGPLGGIAGTALSQVLLGKDKGTDDEIYNALQSASPDLILRIKEADNNFKLDMEKLGVDTLKLQYSDIADARNREVEIIKHNKDNRFIATLSMITMPCLAMLITAGFFCTMGLIAFLNIDAEAAQVLNILAGILGTCFVQIISYYFGSSLGSRMKDMPHS